MTLDVLLSFYIFIIFAILLVPFGSGQQRNKQDGFNCPEEFGYYPHPTDCSQYYVCVFGGALLESCTGGLMYSHDLQTCDWPRNVGCGSAIIGTVNNSPTNAVKHQESRIIQTTPSWRSQLPQTRPEEIPDRHLYEEEDLGPAEEVEQDRQQRVYRGQPPTLGQVARDRDGIVRHANALQTSAGPEKGKPIAVAPLSPHHQLRVPPVRSQYVIEQSAIPVSATVKATYNSSHLEPYYNSYDEDSELYRENNDYQRFPEQKRIKQGQSYEISQQRQQQLQQPQHQHQQPQQQSFVTRQPSFTVQDYALPNDEDVQTQQSEKLSFRGRNRGSITYSTSPSEYEAAPVAPGGKPRPTLKPSQSIVSKVSEFIDIYKFPPKRAEPIYPTPQVDKAAAKCRKDVCLLPDCSCGGKDIPGDIPVEQTPQIVLLTFDDSVNELNRGLYVDLFEKGRVNPNGCPISATFYVSHEWTDYSMVQNLYAAGHEIASHSVSHSFGEQFSQKKWTKEIAGQREILAAYGGVRQEDIKGMRAPFLAIGGNKMFKMLYDANFTYDSSMPIYENRPPSWPYTLDYKVFHDCMIPPCPTRSYPGVWEVPMVMWQDLNGGRCSMGDACSNPPDSDGVYKMLLKNFERHFNTNRAPFGLFYHSSWFTQPHHKEGFITFLDTIVNMPEVWVVSNWQAIQWARDPTPISRLNNFKPFGCDYPERPRKCNNAKVCNLWHKSGVRYLKTCQPCPDVYPWTGKTGVASSRVDNEDIVES